MTAISFSLFRENIDIDTDLLVQVGIAGTAVLNIDYTISGFDSYTNTPPLPIGRAIIPAGLDTCQIICTPTPGLVQPDRTVTLVIEPSSGIFAISATKPQATGILTFPGAAPPPPAIPTIDFTVSPTAILESAAATAVFTATRRVGSSLASPLPINYAIAGTATIGVDYALSDSSGILVILAGQSSATISATAIPNSVITADRTIQLIPQLSPANYLLGTVDWTCTIVEDSPPPPVGQIRIIAQTQLISQVPSEGGIF